MEMHLERAPVADDEQRVAHLFERRLEASLVEALALDHETGAVPVLRELLMDRVETQRLALDGRVGKGLARGPVDHPPRDLDQPRSARVHDAGVAKDVEHLGRARQRILSAGEDGGQEVRRRQTAGSPSSLPPRPSRGSP